MGTGKSFKNAFKSQFGLTLARAEALFLNYVEQTEGKPTERFHGTVYEGFGGSKPR